MSAGEQPRRFSLKGLVIGLFPLALATGFAIVGTEDLLLCRKIISEGVETNAVVLERDTGLRSSSQRRRGVVRRRAEEVNFSIFEFAGHRGRVNFWIEEDVVPVIYLKPLEAPQQGFRVPVVIGQKSEAFLTIYNRNFNWGFVVFSAMMFLFCGMWATVFIAGSLGFRLRRNTPAATEVTTLGEVH